MWSLPHRQLFQMTYMLDGCMDADHVLGGSVTNSTSLKKFAIFITEIFSTRCVFSHSGGTHIENGHHIMHGCPHTDRAVEFYDSKRGRRDYRDRGNLSPLTRPHAGGALRKSRLGTQSQWSQDSLSGRVPRWDAICRTIEN